MFIATQFGSADALPLGAHEIAGKTTFDLEHGNRKYQSNWLMCVSLSFLFFLVDRDAKYPWQPDIESLMNCPGIYKTRNLLHSTISDCCIPLREVLGTNQYKWMGSSWYFLRFERTELLSSNADPNLARQDDGVTPVYMAVQNGHFKALWLQKIREKEFWGKIWSM